MVAPFFHEMAKNANYPPPLELAFPGGPQSDSHTPRVPDLLIRGGRRGGGMGSRYMAGVHGKAHACMCRGMCDFRVFQACVVFFLSQLLSSSQVMTVAVCFNCSRSFTSHSLL